MTDEEKRGVGQPKKELDALQKSQVEKLASVLSKKQLAEFFGVSENTYRRIEKDDPEILEAYKKGKAKAIASVAGNLVNQAQNGNTAAAIFYLKTQAGWRETQVVEVAEVKTFADMYEQEPDDEDLDSDFGEMYDD